MNYLHFIFLFAGLLAGVIVAWLIFRNRQGMAALALENEKKLAEQRLTDLQAQAASLVEHNQKLQTEVIQLTAELSRSREQVAQLQQRLESEKQELQQRIEEFVLQAKKDFELTANRLVEEKGKKLDEQHQRKLETVLQPFRERLSEFQQLVKETYEKEVREVITLKEQVRILHDLNQRITEETSNLTRALKADTRQQGRWGEVILERILEYAGLQKGIEYQTQVSLLNRNGENIRPDVVVYLPENKHLIIDSKVSLTAFDRYVALEQEEERKKALSEHIASVRKHVKDLAEKDYYTSQELRTPELVLLFVPTEPAFIEALRADAGLFAYAWERRIVLVSPATLLATMQTVASLWKIEKQNRNAQEIARLSGDLYDKVCGVVSELQDLGKALNKAEEEYNKFVSGLTSEKNNVLRLAERIKRMGAKTTKSLPPSLLEAAGNDDDDEPPQPLPQADNRQHQ